MKERGAGSGRVNPVRKVLPTTPQWEVRAAAVGDLADTNVGVGAELPSLRVARCLRHSRGVRVPLSGRCTYAVNRRRGAEAEAEVGGGDGWKGR